MTTADAAKLLGLSMATVQKLADNNSLQAWKTFGGHRRISMASVLNYQSINNFTKYSRSDSTPHIKMMVVLDPQPTSAQPLDPRIKWDMPITANYFDSLMEGLLELANEKYDLLVLQLTSSKTEQIKTLEILQKLMRTRHTLGHALILSVETDLLRPDESIETPISMEVINKPLTQEWLSAYLTGFGAALHRTR